MITRSGAVVLPDNVEVPTLLDIGLGLADEVRYARQSRLKWTVLQHSIACDMYAASQGWPRIARLHCLLHDAHEAVIGDIPYPWKTQDMRERQEELDIRIRRSLGLREPGVAVARMVALADAEVLLAEVFVLGTDKQQAVVTAWLGRKAPSQAAIDAVHAAYDVTAHRSADVLAQDFEALVKAHKANL